MRIHEVLLVPGAGHFGQGLYDRGHCSGNLAEVDLVDQYIFGICEELDQAAVRHKIMATRKAPGIPAEDRLKGVMPFTLVLHCRIGWNQKKNPRAQTNISTVAFGNEGSAILARDISGIMSHWGKLYVHGHKGGGSFGDTTDPLLNIPGTWGIRLDPFRLNEPGATDYARHMVSLGRDIGRFIADYCRGRKDSSAMMPTAIFETNSKVKSF